MDKILIVGSSGHSKAVIDAIESKNEFKIIGLIDSYQDVGAEIEGYKVIGGTEDLATLVDKYKVYNIHVAIGDNKVRKRVVLSIKNELTGLSFPSLVHSTAAVSTSVMIGDGCLVMAGAVINRGAVLGGFCIVNTNSSLDHDGFMKDFSSLAPGVCTGGNVHVGVCSALCIGSVVSHGVKVGDYSVVGAGSLVLEDVSSEALYFGSPARFVKKISKTYKYL